MNFVEDRFYQIVKTSNEWLFPKGSRVQCVEIFSENLIQQGKPGLCFFSEKNSKFYNVSCFSDGYSFKEIIDKKLTGLEKEIDELFTMGYRY